MAMRDEKTSDGVKFSWAVARFESMLKELGIQRPHEIVVSRRIWNEFQEGKCGAYISIIPTDEPLRGWDVND